MTKALLQAGLKTLGSRMAYTGITKQKILSRTKIARKHQIFIRYPSPHAKQEEGNPEENRSAEFHGKDTPNDISTMIYVPRSTRGRHLGTRQCSNMSVVSIQRKYHNRICTLFKDDAPFCYCAYVLRISRWFKRLWFLYDGVNKFKGIFPVLCGL